MLIWASLLVSQEDSVEAQRGWETGWVRRDIRGWSNHVSPCREQDVTLLTLGLLTACYRALHLLRRRDPPLLRRRVLKDGAPGHLAGGSNVGRLHFGSGRLARILFLVAKSPCPNLGKGKVWFHSRTQGCSMTNFRGRGTEKMSSAVSWVGISRNIWELFLLSKHEGPFWRDS